MKSCRVLLLSALLSFSLSACVSTGSTSSPTSGGGSGVSYGDSKAVETVTTDLGSTDIQMTAEKMTISMLQHPLLQDIIRRRGLLMASPVENKTSEYFDTKLITDTILTQLQKNGVRYVIAGDEMQNQTDELIRQNQSGLYKKSSTAKVGNMQGAQYRIDGSVSSIVKRSASVKDVYYKINMRLIEIESGIVEWSDEKEIRKTLNR
ncbi:MAG: penicillin-binding protein activator LpoB [Betaproteobacteria bacterium]|jgi:uncharacterized protein (TIGR02722 family)|nr:penicillin-binding protein activator LpoB [Betaproteobacteria bacterium]